MDIKKAFLTIESELNVVDEIIQSSASSLSIVSKIPPTLRGEENLEETLITPELLKGESALDSAVEAWKDIRIIDKYSLKASRRSSGIVHVSPDETDDVDSLVACIERINTLKTEIERYIVTEFATRNERYEALHTQCPDAHTLHLYRHIRYWNEADLSVVSFSWRNKTALYTPEKDALLTRMTTDSSGRPIETKNIPFLNEMINKVMRTPSHQLRIRRKVKVQPVANMMFFNNENPLVPIRESVAAAMPFIVIQSRIPEIKPLGIYDHEARKLRKERQDKPRNEVIGNFNGETIEVSYS